MHCKRTPQTKRVNQLRHLKLQLSGTASLQPAAAAPTEAFHPALPHSAHHNDHVSFGEQTLRQEAAVLHTELHDALLRPCHPVNFAPTVISEQRLCRTLALGAGGFRAAAAVEANATVGAAVAPCCPVAAVDAPLAQQQRHLLSACRLLASSKKDKKVSQSLLFQSGHQWTPGGPSLEQCWASHLRGEEYKD